MGAWIDRKSQPAGASFCPYCGVGRLVSETLEPHTADYICQVCFCGFRLSESARVSQANRIFKMERSCRQGARIHHGISPELKTEWDRISRFQGLVRAKSATGKPVMEKKPDLENTPGGAAGFRCWTEPCKSKTNKLQAFIIRYGTQR